MQYIFCHFLLIIYIILEGHVLKNDIFLLLKLNNDIVTKTFNQYLGGLQG